MPDFNQLHRLHAPHLNGLLVDDIPPNRLKGRSTGLALQYLSQAILNPHTKVVVKDHVDTRTQNAILARVIHEMCGKLGLQFIHTGRDGRGDWYIEFRLHAEGKPTEKDNSELIAEMRALRQSLKNADTAEVAQHQKRQQAELDNMYNRGGG